MNHDGVHISPPVSESGLLGEDSKEVTSELRWEEDQSNSQCKGRKVIEGPAMIKAEKKASVNEQGQLSRGSLDQTPQGFEVQVRRLTLIISAMQTIGGY